MISGYGVFTEHLPSIMRNTHNFIVMTLDLYYVYPAGQLHLMNI